MEVAREKMLPSPEERRRILEQAGVILAEARALAHLLDDQRDQETWTGQARQVSFEAHKTGRIFRAGAPHRSTFLHLIARSSSR